MIELLSTGLPNSVQDRGRFGYLDAGVSLCGAMDRPALEAANALAGNKADEAGIEVALFPFRLRFHAAARFAVTGALGNATLDGLPLPPWWTITAREGQELRLERPKRGARNVIAFAGGIDVLAVLGSRSTDAKGGFGGMDGRGLKRGDRLPLAQPDRAGFGGEFGVTPPWLDTDWTTLRVLPAAEFDAFTLASRDAFFNESWTVSAEANRQGCRLEGPVLTREQPRELFSHGIVPGTVQVPPAGQVIIQLADANTCGGYPKLATVIEADLWKLAQAGPGTGFRFAETTRPEAISALRELETGIRMIREAARLALRA